MKKLAFFMALFLLNSCFAQSADSLQASVESAINHLNSEVIEISSLISNEEAELARQKIITLNAEMREIMGQQTLYQSILEIKKTNPSYNLPIINPMPANMMPSTYEALDDEIRAKFKETRDAIESAKQKIAMAEFKTAMAIVIVAAKTMDESFQRGINTGIIKLIAWEYANQWVSRKNTLNDAQVLQNNMEQLVKTREGQNQLISELNELKKDLIQQHHYLNRIQLGLISLTAELEELQRVIGNAKNHVESAKTTNVLNDINYFDSSQFISLLDDAKSQVMLGKIKWNDYFYAKNEIKNWAKDAYERLEEKNEASSNDYNSFLSYYESFDSEIVLQRQQALAGIASLMNEWKSKTSSLINEYNLLNFSDSSIIALQDIDIAMPEINIFDNSIRQMTTPYSSLEIELPNASRELNYQEPWAEPLINYCIELSHASKNIHELVNYARENEAGSRNNPKTGFSSLLSNEIDSAKAISNFESIIENFREFPNYAMQKSIQAQKLIELANEAKKSYEKISDYAQNAGEIYLPKNDYCYGYDLLINTQEKLKGYFSQTIGPCEALGIYDFIILDLQNFALTSDNIDYDCAISQGESETHLIFEQEKLDFIINLGANANKLVLEMKNHQGILQKANNLKENWENYLALQSSFSVSEKEYYSNLVLNSINSLIAEENLNDFVSIQKKIKELALKIKPSANFYEGTSGFKGEFAVLEKDREVILELANNQFIENHGIMLEDFETSFFELKGIIQSQDSGQSFSKMQDLFYKMQGYYIELQMHKSISNIEQVVYGKADSLWRCQILSEFANSEGFKNDSVSKGFYERAINPYLQIIRAYDSKYGWGIDENYYVLTEYSDSNIVAILKDYSEYYLVDCGFEKFIDSWRSAQSNGDYDEEDELDYDAERQRQIDEYGFFYDPRAAEFSDYDFGESDYNPLNDPHYLDIFGNYTSEQIASIGEIKGIQKEENNYVVSIQKESKILGLIPVTLEINAYYDIESRQKIKDNLPWWSFLLI